MVVNMMQFADFSKGLGSSDVVKDLWFSVEGASRASLRCRPLASRSSFGFSPSAQAGTS